MLLFYFSVHRRPGGDEHIWFDAQAGAAVFLGFHKKKPRRGVRLILHKGQTLRLEAVRPQHSQHLGQTLGPMAEGKLSAVLQQAETAGADILEGAVRLVAGRSTARVGALRPGGKVGRVAGADIELALPFPEGAQVGEIRGDVLDALRGHSLL